MTKNIGFLFILLIISILYSCRKIWDTGGEGLVINEVMPVNSTTVADNYGDYDDWIELYNLSSGAKDISGYYLSDNNNKRSKWQFPQGTLIAAKGYLIIWADNDINQLGLHANFKLSSAGEAVVLSDADSSKIDKISFLSQTLELSYSRVPDGTGEFRWQTPTFAKTNDLK